MKQRKPAPPIFNTDEIDPVVEVVSNPLPKMEPMDIQIGDSDDDSSSSSFEEITLNPGEKASMTSKVIFWEFIAELGWQDRPRMTQTIRNRVSTKYSGLNTSNKDAFQTHIKYFSKKLNRAIERKKLIDKFSRKLNNQELSSLLQHVIMRGESFYNTIIDDPSPVGYLVGATSSADEFVSFNFETLQ